MGGFEVKPVLRKLAAPGLILGAFPGFELWSATEMQRLGIVIYVTNEVIEKGAVVSIMTRKVPVDEFEARYPVPETEADVPGAPRAARQWSGTISGPVTMVSSDIPDDTSYSYRFRSVPVDGVAEANVPERVLVIGGINYDAESRDMSYSGFGVMRAHEIAQLDAGRAWIPTDLDYKEEELVCEDGLGVRVCVPTQATLTARAKYLTKSSPGVRGVAPWDP